MQIYSKLERASVLATALMMTDVATRAQLSVSPVPTSPILGGRILTLVEIAGWVSSIAQFLINVSMVVAVIFIVLGGMRFMVAGADQERVEEAKMHLRNTIIGTLVVLGIGLIMQTLASLVQQGITY